MKDQSFLYEVLHLWSEEYYKGLLGKEHVQDFITIGGGRNSDRPPQRFVFLQNGLYRYLLPLEAFGELPLLPTSVSPLDYRGKPYTVINGFKSARFKPVKGMEFRQLIDDLCSFTHENEADYTLWKIIATGALISRLAFRVCSQPAFGKDSVMKVLGYLTGDVCVIANPTVAKLEYRLTNKVLLLNEFANLKSEDRYGMEHFLQSVGDLSNTYEKRSRAGQGTTESFNIGELSIVCAYNDLECYPDDSKYFDNVFSQQTKERFFPIKFKGKISEQITNVQNPGVVASEKNEYLQSFMRTIVYYKTAWRDELKEKRTWSVKVAADYGIESRWAVNFDRMRDFILLYSKTPEEAQGLLNRLYNRHLDYKEQFKSSFGNGFFTEKRPRMEEEIVVTEEVVV